MQQHFRDRGGNTALLVIDVQNAVMESGWNRETVIDNIGQVIATARDTGLPVVYVQHEAPSSDRMRRGSDGWHICPEVAPITGEPIIHKQYGDAFVETDLPETLASLGVGHLIIAGAQSDACIRATTHRALAEGYDITLVGDAHTTEDAQVDGATISGEICVSLVNYATPWISYPDTTSTVMSHTDVIASLSASAKV